MPIPSYYRREDVHDPLDIIRDGYLNTFKNESARIAIDRLSVSDEGKAFIKAWEYNKGFEFWVLNIQNAIVTMSQVDNVLQRRLGFNDTYISGIAFTDNEYKTVRGVSVGDGWEKVVSIYGKNNQIDSESGCRFYQYFDMRLSFCLDLSNKVHSILFEDYPVKPESKLN
ncbi:hypothetical protein [Atlantibacter hermannii]|uniref:hypothetical protein n=1 Tax=Atlantibacter hermannii TaxID=565 RepID=UPI002FDA218C